MFTIFLTAMALVVCALMGALLLRRRPDAEPFAVPYAGLTVLATAIGLVALGLWMV